MSIHAFRHLLVGCLLLGLAGCQRGVEPGAPEPAAAATDTSPTPVAAVPDVPASETSAAPAETRARAAQDDHQASAAEAAIANEVPVASPATGQSARVRLGSPELTAGIPGEGPLTIEQIQQWLDNPANHQPLDVELPEGLAAGSMMIYIPEDNPITRAKIELGRQLYFDPRLCGDATVSCASCHAPDEGYARHTQFGVGIGGQTGNRNSPTSYNRILSHAQFWDGRAGSLEEQAIGPIANPIEMGNTHEQACETIASIEGYRLQFERIFGGEVDIEKVGKAIATFERTIVTGASPFDYWEPVRRIEQAVDVSDLEAFEEEDPDLYEQYVAAKAASDAEPMSESAKRGYALFFGQKAGCTACHTGPNFTDEKYHNLGVGMDVENPDLGRYEVTKDEKDRGAFKTPTLRNVALTAPYMHDGSQKSLAEVVEWYDKGGHPNPWLSKDIRKLNLTDQEKADLVAFMEALTGEFPTVESERLPE